MAKSKFVLRNLINAIQDENTSLAEDALSSAEYTGFIDTGSYIFNAQLSGSLYGGLPNTKILELAGEQAVGKTFFALGMIHNFLEADPQSIVIWYLAEPAVTRKMLVERKIDPNRVIFAEPITIEDFKFHATKTLKAYSEAKDHPPMMMVLDSLGALSTNKEITDTAKADTTKDMTKPGLIKGAFRVLTPGSAPAKVPFIVTNHVYAQMVGYAPKQIGGGFGPMYAGDIIATMSSSKEKAGDDVIGHIIKIKMFKNRVAKQNTLVEVQLRYDTGLSRYYGLLDLGEKYGIVTKIKAKPATYEIGGETGTPNKIYASPEKYFTKDVMELLEVAANQEFEYGKTGKEIDDNSDTIKDDTESVTA